MCIEIPFMQKAIPSSVAMVDISTVVGVSVDIYGVSVDVVGLTVEIVVVVVST